MDAAAQLEQKFKPIYEKLNKTEKLIELYEKTIREIQVFRRNFDKEIERNLTLGSKFYTILKAYSH